MTLLERFFERAIVLRGEEYTSRVAVVSVSASRVVAKVRGTRLYTVALVKAGSTLKAWCTCPYCEGELAPCKHVWATLRKVGIQALLTAPPKPESLALEPELLAVTPGNMASVRARRARVFELEQGEGFAEGADDLDEDDYFEFDDGDDGDGEDDHAEDGGESSMIAALGMHGVGAGLVSWAQLLATSRWQHEASMRERPVRTELRYLVIPSELRLGRASIYLVEAAHAQDAPGTLVCATASERVRRLGRDARTVEHWLAGQSDAYGSPRVTAEPHWDVFPDVLRELAGTGRLHVGERRRHSYHSPVFDAAVDPLRWEEEPFRLELEVRRAPPEPERSMVEYRVQGWLARSAERRALGEASVLTAAGIALVGNVVAPFEHQGMFGIVAALRASHTVPIVGEAELEAFVRDYHLSPSPAPLVLPDGERLVEAAVPLGPVLDLSRPDGGSKVSANVWFEYDEWRAAAVTPGNRILDWPKRQLLRRDVDAERTRLEERWIVLLAPGSGGSRRYVRWRHV
jgi:hypothetical protein